MEITTVNISEISEHPTLRLDAEYWMKKKDLQIGTKVIVAANTEGNMCEPFIGMQGTIIRFKNKDWYVVKLDTQSIYGWIFNFHIDELEILNQ